MTDQYETEVSQKRENTDKYKAGLRTEAAKRIERFDPFPGADRHRPWTDKELLERLYIEEKLSFNQIRKGWDCSINTVRTWIDKHGIEKRSRSEAAQNAYGTLNQVSFHTDRRGREIWSTGEFTFVVHRLIAVAEYGIEPVKNMHVHHKSGVPWDNRPGNLQLVTNSEHHTLHRKIDGLDRLRIAEFYEHGDISSRKLGEMFDVSNGTVLRIHKECFGEDVCQ